MKRVFFTLVLAMMTIGVASAQENTTEGNSEAQELLNKGVSCFAAKNYEEAVQWYLQAAEQGSTEAQFNLGDCYLNGLGVTRDAVEAAKWFRKAAELGHAKSQNNLGLCYVRGEGVPQDLSESAKWFHKAAEQGLADAQFNLGVAYYNDDCFSEAFMWLRKAAQQGHTNAQSVLDRFGQSW